MSPSTDVLHVEDVSLTLGGTEILYAVGLGVVQGSIVGLVGPNGAGKSSLLNVISGLYEAQSGSVTFQGRKINGMRPWRVAGCGIARTFQNVELVENATLVDNVLLGKHLHSRAGLLESMLHVGRARSEERAGRSRARDLLEIAGIHPSRAGQLISSLSFAEKKLVEIARALAMDPALLLLDEPASGMSRKDKAGVITTMNRLRAAGLTQVLVEHDMALVAAVCDHVVVLDAGKVIATGPPDVVLREQVVIDAYLGPESQLT